MPSRLAPLIPGAAPPINLNRPVLLIGRHPECDVRLDLPQVSRRHCCVALAYDRVTIRDLGSRHGVRLNGRIVHEARVVPGDEVAIGHLLYRYEDAQASVASSTRSETKAQSQSQSKPPPEPEPVSELPQEPSLPPLPVDFGDLDLGDLFPTDSDR